MSETIKKLWVQQKVRNDENGNPMNDDPKTGLQDPLLARRAQVARLSSIGRKIGYLSMLAATVVLIVGLTTKFTAGYAMTVTVLLVGGSIILAPAILLHYAIRDTERELANTQLDEKLK